MTFLENIKLDKILIIINTILLTIILFLLGFLVYKHLESTKEPQVISEIASLENSEYEDTTSDKNLEIQEDEIYVDIKGAVKNPGVYKVTQDSIINDVVKLAGGLKSNASTQYTNLSKKVSSEMVITIFTTSEVSKMDNQKTEVCQASTENISSCQNSSIVEISSSSNNSETSVSNNDENNKISINTATKEQLITLTGIGESKADSIIEYREKNNGFQTLEELMNVSGIGESAYEKIKDNIKL